jgi:hypothetical protein
MIVPVMDGCSDQWYGTVPALVHLWGKVRPIAAADEVKAPGVVGSTGAVGGLVTLTSEEGSP